MRFKILGSGGAAQIPRACCECDICKEAREKGIPYSRRGQSLFLEDIKVLFDTPESISGALNHFRINSVSYIFYSHFHPDHTMGCRIIEEIKCDCTENPIVVNLPEGGICISINEFSSLLEYYKAEGYCLLIKDKISKIGNITIARIPLDNKFADGFLIKEENKKIFYCPCHAMHTPKNMDILHGLDLMILGIGELVHLEEDITHFYRDIIPLIQYYKPKQVLLTHIEEYEKLSYDDYCELEQRYIELNIKCAYDGMVVDICT